MKIGEYEVREDRTYDRHNNWIKVEADVAVFGLTDVAVRRAKEIAFIELPKKGQAVEIGKGCGQIESAKWAGEIVAPLSGEIIEVNDEVSNDPSVLNKDPYGHWLAKIKIAKTAEASQLMDPQAAADWVKAEFVDK